MYIVTVAAYCIEAAGQRIRLTDTTNTWRVSCNGVAGGRGYSLFYDYRLDGDTTINGYMYKRLAGTTKVLHLDVLSTGYQPAGTYFIREDIVAGKVWCRSVSANRDFLIYNDSWAVNDTIDFNFYISGIDSTQMDGQWYKVFTALPYYPSPAMGPLVIVEGMGSTAGPAYAFTGVNMARYSIWLQCFNHNGSKPTLNPSVGGFGVGGFSNTSSCSPLAVNSLVHGEGSFLSPNPANSHAKIMLPYSMRQGRLIIYNSAGQTISGTSVSNTATVPLPGVITIPGLYFYRITDQKDGSSFTGRFVYE